MAAKKKAATKPRVPNPTTRAAAKRSSKKKQPKALDVEAVASAAPDASFGRRGPGPVETVVVAATDGELDRMLPGWRIPEPDGMEWVTFRNPTTGEWVSLERPRIARPRAETCIRTPDWSTSVHVRWRDHHEGELAGLVAGLVGCDPCEIQPSLEDPARVGPAEWLKTTIGELASELVTTLVELDPEDGLATLARHAWRDTTVDRVRTRAVIELARHARDTGRKVFAWMDDTLGR